MLLMLIHRLGMANQFWSIMDHRKPINSLVLSNIKNINAIQ